MLTCIACSKQLEDADEDTTARGTPSTKDAVKSLTSQIKDMVLKFSGVYRQCKPSGSSSLSSSRQNAPHYYTAHMGDYNYISESAQDVGKGRSKRYGGTWEPVRSGGGSALLDACKSSQYHVWNQGVVGNDGGIGADVPAVVEEEEFEEEAREWVAQVEPGVHITFAALPQGGNDLKRIRFSREMFNKWQAQRWWGENYDKVMELYNVQRFNRQALPTPPRSEDERGSPYSRVGSTKDSPTTPPWGKDHLPSTTTTSTTAASSRAPTATSTTAEATKMMMYSKPPDNTTAKPTPPDAHNNNLIGGGPASGIGGAKADTASADASRTTTSSRDEASMSVSNASDAEANEWVEQDEPGVYITIRQLPDGARELRRVRFSRERFGEVHAKLWWEENRERIHAQYL